MNLEPKHKRWIAIGGIILIIVLTYIGGVSRYRSRFIPNTQVAHTSISGLTPEEAQTKINEEIGAYPIAFIETDQELGYVELEQLGVTVDAREQLTNTLNEQNPYSWPIALFRTNQQVSINQSLQHDPELMNGLIATLGVNNEERKPTANAHLLEDENNNIAVVDEIYGDQISLDSMTRAINQTVSTGQNTMDLEEAYVKPSITQDSPAISDLFAHVDIMKQTEITLEFDGQTHTIPTETVASWVYIDEVGQPQVDTHAIEDYIFELNRQHASLFQPRQFMSTYQGERTVQPGTFGWYIDRFAEAEEITNNIHAGGSYIREPVIGGSGYGQENEIGGDYVEVDITNQMMLVYRGGQLMLETPIVSGETGTNTIPGTYQVWQKLEDTNLVGYNPVTEVDYSTPVDYWIAFDDQAQGIHDAKWQQNFGGNVYQTSGSLGCINTPPGIMGEVFELVEIGMPVLVFE